MTFQHQIVAIVGDRKERWKKSSTEAYQLFQRTDQFSGFTRTYRPTREDEAQLPPENKRPQASVGGVLSKMKAAMISALDTVRTQDEGNMLARADLVLFDEDSGNTETIKDIPATHLLFLEKQATDILTMAQAIPVLDNAEVWNLDQASGLYRTDPHGAIRTRKVPRVIVKYDATKEHPAQTEMITEDIPVGVFDTTRFSGAVPQTEKDRIVRRATIFAESVKKAREQANTVEVTDSKEGGQIYDFIFGE